MKKDISGTIKISPKSILTITYGQKTWTFKMKGNEMNSSNNKTNQNVNTKEFQDGSISIWDIIIGIIIGVVISAIGFCWLKNIEKQIQSQKRVLKNNSRG